MLQEDFSIYFDPNGTGDSATFNGDQLNGLFERNYIEVNEVEGYYPTFLCATEDTAAMVVDESVITIESIDYVVASIRPQGDKTTLLILMVN